MVDATLFGWHLWHARNGSAYNTWSGWLADLALITIPTTIVAALAAWWRKHNCHVHGCWRLQWHPHPEHQHPVCSLHHPHGHPGLLRRLLTRCPHPDGHFLNARHHHYNQSECLTPQGWYVQMGGGRTALPRTSTSGNVTDISTKRTDG